MVLLQGKLILFRGSTIFQGVPTFTGGSNFFQGGGGGGGPNANFFRNLETHIVCDFPGGSGPPIPPPPWIRTCHIVCYKSFQNRIEGDKVDQFSVK